MPPGAGGQCVVCCARANLQRGAGWGRAPPVAGRRCSVWPGWFRALGGATTPARLPRAAQPRGASAVGGRSAQSAALFRGQGVPPLRGPASSAGRPRRCAALSPVCCPLAPVSPPARRVPPLWRWAALRPWDGGARPSPAPALCCTRPATPPGAWFFFAPTQGGLWFPAPWFCVPVPSSARQVGPGGQNAENGAKMGEKRRKTAKMVAKTAHQRYNGGVQNRA